MPCLDTWPVRVLDISHLRITQNDVYLFKNTISYLWLRTDLDPLTWISSSRIKYSWSTTKANFTSWSRSSAISKFLAAGSFNTKWSHCVNLFLGFQSRVILGIVAFSVLLTPVKVDCLDSVCITESSHMILLLIIFIFLVLHLLKELSLLIIGHVLKQSIPLSLAHSVIPKVISAPSSSLELGIIVIIGISLIVTHPTEVIHSLFGLIIISSILIEFRVHIFPLIHHAPHPGLEQLWSALDSLVLVELL